MRNLLFTTVLLLLVGFSKAQTTETKAYTFKEIHKAAEFPGCENEASDLTLAQKCLSNQLTKALVHSMDEMPSKMLAMNEKRASAMIQMVLTKEGVLTHFEKRGSQATSEINDFLADAVIASLEDYAKNLSKFKPAQLEDGTAVDMSFSLPVTFNLDY